jgi:DNA repair photolyase
METSICKKTKMKPKISGTREWADYNVNCVSGCSNNCRYCYAKMMAKRFGRATEETWKIMKINPKKVNKNYSKKPGRVMFPSSHDITDDPDIENACFSVLSNLLENGNEVLVTTKPRFSVIEKIVSRFKEYQDMMQFRFTITSLDDVLLQFWEPNAPPFQERMASLKFAFNKGFLTSVSIEPFLDYHPEELVRYVESYCSESIWIGKMNYIRRNNLTQFEKKYYEAVRKNYTLEHVEEIYSNLKENPKIRFKDSFGMIIG